MSSDIFIGLKERIHFGGKLEDSSILRILEECRTEKEMDLWVEANDFHSCIAPAKGYQSCLKHLHILHMQSPMHAGMIYVDRGSEQPRTQTDFKGTFGGRLTFFLGEKGVPVLAKNRATFKLKDNEDVKYTVTWANLMVAADPATLKEFNVSCISYEKAGSRSIQWVFHCNGTSPFGKGSGRHIVLVDWKFDRDQVEPFCIKMNARMESFEEITRAISGYLKLDVCTEDHIKVKGLKIPS